jgi:hypothetical protein
LKNKLKAKGLGMTHVVEHIHQPLLPIPSGGRWHMVLWKMEGI